MVNLEWYRTFKAIYQTGTLTQASKELLISQPNVSQHLSFLEAHIGKKLFERKPRQMVATDYGKLFYAQLVGPIDELVRLEAEFRYTRASDIPLTCIGVSKDYYQKKMINKISELPVNLVFEFKELPELVDNLLQGDLNFLISSHCGNEKNICYEPIFQEKEILVASADINTEKLEQFVKDNQKDNIENWLVDQNWYAYSSDLVLIKHFWMENFKRRPNIKPSLIIPDFQSLILTLCQGCGLSIVPDYLVENELKSGVLKTIWSSYKKNENTLYLAYNKNIVTSNQIEMIRTLVQD